MIKRVVGLIIIVVSLIAVAISVAGTLYAQRVVDGLSVGFGEISTLALDSFDAATDSLLLVRATVEEVNGSLVTVQKSAQDVAKTLDDTQPLIVQVSDIVSESVPDSLDALEAASPNLIQIAGSVDNTLRLLSDFQVKQVIPIINYEIDFDLGVVEYDPVQPFDESVEAITSSFEGVPEQMRLLADDIDLANDNISVISGDIVAISADIDDINAQVAQVPAQIDEFVALLGQLEADIGTVETNFTSQLQNIKLGITIFMVWIGLLQLAPLVVGWQLLTGKRDSAEN